MMKQVSVIVGAGRLLHRDAQRITKTVTSTSSFSERKEWLSEQIAEADYVLIGAGAGLMEDSTKLLKKRISCNSRFVYRVLQRARSRAATDTERSGDGHGAERRGATRAVISPYVSRLTPHDLNKPYIREMNVETPLPAVNRRGTAILTSYI